MELGILEAQEGRIMMGIGRGSEGPGHRAGCFTDSEKLLVGYDGTHLQVPSVEPCSEGGVESATREEVATAGQ